MVRAGPAGRRSSLTSEATRLAQALRTTLETHLTLVDSIEEANHEDEDQAKVTYLARTPQARDAARREDTGENSIG